jgi:type III pantothenate kinase
MNAHLVADVGNSRIKWGLCALLGRPEVVCTVSLGDDAAEWDAQLAKWAKVFGLDARGGSLAWAVAGVHPERCGRLRDWVVSRRDRAVMIDRYEMLPLTVGVDEPGRVGLDRLLNAVAARNELPPGAPAVLVDAGSAVTVDWLDEEHVFRGGAIFPGVRLMAKALHDRTALLPEVQVGPAPPPLPGRSTVPAIQAGVFGAVIGGVERIARRLASASREPHVFLTGGDAEWIVQALVGGPAPRIMPANDPPPWMAEFTRRLWPEQTLQGVLLSAAALPP